MAVWFPFTSNLGLKPEKSHFHYCLVNGDSHTVMDHDTSSPLYGLLFHHVSPMIISWGENWMQLFWRGKFTGNPHRSILQKKTVFPVFRFSCSHSMDLHHFPFWAFLHGVALAIQNPLSMETIYGTVGQSTIILGDFPAMFDLENVFQSRLIWDCPAMLDQRVTQYPISFFLKKNIVFSSWLDISTPISECLSLFVFFG